jgi:hypothetical protein
MRWIPQIGTGGRDYSDTGKRYACAGCGTKQGSSVDHRDFQVFAVLCLTRLPCADRRPPEKRFVVTAAVLQESGQAAPHSGQLGKIRVPGKMAVIRRRA